MHWVRRRVSHYRPLCGIFQRQNVQPIHSINTCQVSYVIHQTSQSNPRVPQWLPYLAAPHLRYASQRDHVRDVFNLLQENGIVRITLGFPDETSLYLERLIFSLHKSQGHGLPITHSAYRGWFWDVRPSTTNFQGQNHQARSETMEEFPWHTDCCYEDPPPRLFALHVLQPDRYGGGILSIMNVERLIRFLSPEATSALLRPEYRIAIPPEFTKHADHQYIIGNILAHDETDRPGMMRFRGEIMSGISKRAQQALVELHHILEHCGGLPNFVLRLTSELLPKGSIILIDNRRWLHARNAVNDPQRHLRRCRWDATPFPNIYD